MPKVKLTPIKQKTKKEEIKEIIQNPDDPLAKYPLRAFAYSNEVGAAVSAMPVWGKTAEALLWLPALMYLGADIYDKYRRGKEGDYTKASAAAAVQQAIFQALSSVIFPIVAVKFGQRIAGYCAKFDGSHLSATAKEETFNRLLDEFDNKNFAKGSVVAPDGTLKSGFDRVKERIIDEKLKPALASTRKDLETEGLFSKIVRFFGHTKRPVACAKTNETYVLDFFEKQAKKIFDKQTILENSTRDSIASEHPELLKLYDKATKNSEKRAKLLIENAPDYLVKKILNSEAVEQKPLIQAITQKYDSIEKRRILVKDKTESSAVVKELLKNPQYKKQIENFANRVEIARTALRTYIKGKSIKLGLLQTAGGFIALGLMAVPIDNFVHKYIIKKFVEPGIETVESIKNKNRQPVDGRKIGPQMIS